MKTTCCKILFILFFTVLYCEYLIYFVVIKQCSWPEFQNEHEKTTLKAVFLADTHLLGPYRGHWFDKLRREWQMYRSFQTAMYFFPPDVVFILGDLFDEGQWCDKTEIDKYIARFFSLFKVPQNTQLYVVPGNHDLGFHYVLRPDLIYIFEHTFNISDVEFLNLKGNYFVLINSMAMEGDDCYFCFEAERKLAKISADLKCMRTKTCKGKKRNKTYSRPFILQHFPMYRKSDSECSAIDEAPENIKNTVFRERWDCLSKEASEMIFNTLNPRAVFTGHTHHGCLTVHKNDIYEHTIPSFSWRNKNNPTFTLAKISPDKYTVSKCELPKETTIIFIYCFTVLGPVIWIISKKGFLFLMMRKKFEVSKKHLL